MKLPLTRNNKEQYLNLTLERTQKAALPSVGRQDSRGGVNSTPDHVEWESLNRQLVTYVGSFLGSCNLSKQKVTPLNYCYCTINGIHKRVPPHHHHYYDDHQGPTKYATKAHFMVLKPCTR